MQAHQAEDRLQRADAGIAAPHDAPQTRDRRRAIAAAHDRFERRQVARRPVGCRAPRAARRPTRPARGRAPSPSPARAPSASAESARAACAASRAACAPARRAPSDRRPSCRRAGRRRGRADRRATLSRRAPARASAGARRRRCLPARSFGRRPALPDDGAISGTSRHSDAAAAAATSGDASLASVSTSAFSPARRLGQRLGGGASHAASPSASSATSALSSTRVSRAQRRHRLDRAGAHRRLERRLLRDGHELARRTRRHVRRHLVALFALGLQRIGHAPHAVGGAQRDLVVGVGEQLGQLGQHEPRVVDERQRAQRRQSLGAACRARPTPRGARRRCARRRARSRRRRRCARPRRDRPATASSTSAPGGVSK